jgi:Asp-tRNA(Asn)/Glu-tRNA(Gln) amidotransferase C subunit
MTISRFNTFLEMKKSHSSDIKITKEEKDKVIKELNNMHEILSKVKRKPTEKEKIK